MIISEPDEFGDPNQLVQRVQIKSKIFFLSCFKAYKAFDGIEVDIDIVTQ